MFLESSPGGYIPSICSREHSAAGGQVTVTSPGREPEHRGFCDLDS